MTFTEALTTLLSSGALLTAIAAVVAATYRRGQLDAKLSQVSAMSQDHADRLGEIERRDFIRRNDLDRHCNAQHGSINQRLDNIDNRLEKVDHLLERIEDKLDARPACQRLCGSESH